MKQVYFCGWLAAMVVVIPALARADDSKCVETPRERWVSENAVRASAAAMGYRVRRIAVDDGCYLVKGFDANGARIELKVDPSTGNLIRQDDDE